MGKKLMPPGKPGLRPTWTTGAKEGLGKSLNGHSQVSFTIGKGIVNEIYYPREDSPCTRDIHFIITDGKKYFSDVKIDAVHEIKTIEDGIPSYIVKSTSKDKRYILTNEIFVTPLQNSLLQRIKFKALKGKDKDYQLYISLDPHLNHYNSSNFAKIEDYKGMTMLFAHHDEMSLALACSIPWKSKSVGYHGPFGGKETLRKYKHLVHEYATAGPGNVSLVAEIDLKRDKLDNEIVIAISFGRTKFESGNYARSSLLNGFNNAQELYINGWQKWHKTIARKYEHTIQGKYIKKSLMVLKVNETKRFPGSIIASMSIPWGYSKVNDLGGYHIVWTRDLVESSGVFLTFKARFDAIHILNYLMSVQEADGRWMQCMWLDGKPYWKGLQMDQIAMPIIWVGSCMKVGFLEKARIQRYWPLILKAISFLIRNGPYSEQDRWEEPAPLSPFTIGTEIAALLVFADLAEKMKQPKLSLYCKEIADHWNENIEKWCYVTGTKLAKEVGVEGYYVRYNPDGRSAAELNEIYKSKTDRKEKKVQVPVSEIVSVDALGLVRFGLRDANDPKILNTIKVIDYLLKVETKGGPCWHRFNYDNYGEHFDGRPYDGGGVGRIWPLLTGERAHYEIAAKNYKKADALRRTMESFAMNGLFSEQIWDSKDIPEKDLFLGKPTGSAMPLTWAHAEYIKLCVSLKLKTVIDMPAQTQERYIRLKVPSLLSIWRINHPCPSIKKGKILRIEVAKPAVIYWTINNWKTTKKTKTKDSGLETHYADIPSNQCESEIAFKIFWLESNRFEKKPFKSKNCSYADPKSTKFCVKIKGSE